MEHSTPHRPEDFLTVSAVRKQTATGFTLQPISFTQQRHQNLVVAGATGSGKSTLLKIIAGLVQPDGGEVRFQNKRVLGPDEQLIPGHPGIAYLSQYFELRNNYYVWEELACVNELREEEAATIYDICRIGHLLKRRTNQLSGGEKQRIVTARLLTTAPQLLLLDEPYSNLDMTHRQIMKSVVHDIGERLNITCILISHDPLDTLSWADEILVLKNGQLVQKAAPQTIYRRPVDEYTAGLFGKYNLFTAEQAERFFGLPDFIPPGKRLLVRPEQFRLATKSSSKGIAGMVARSHYFGSYYEVEVLFAEALVIVRSEKHIAANGDAVFVSMALEEPWFV